MSKATDNLISTWRLGVIAGVSTAMAGAALTSFALGKDSDWGHWHLRRYWSGAILGGCGIRHRAVGAAQLDPKQTYIFVSNHYSEWDWYLFTYHVPLNWRAVIRADLRRFPLGGPMAAKTEQLFLAPGVGTDELVEACRPQLELGRSILMYPEGRRPPPGELAAFHSGAFVLASRTGRPVVPVAAVEDPPARSRGPLGRGFAHTPREVVLRVGAPIDAGHRQPDELNALAHQSMERLISGGHA